LQQVFSSKTNMNLTIIIPFLNEGVEVLRTVESIRETATESPAILLINDASEDDYDYRAVAEKYNCTYILHENRMGVANSRQEGVEKCKTEHFLLLDGHMRFYDKGWDKLLLEHLQNNPRALICCQNRTLYKKDDGEIYEKESYRRGYGAYIDFSNFRAKWNYVDPAPFSNIAEIACVYGAAYACNKTYWNRLHGLNGLQTYGSDEQFISMKVWMEGGKCLLTKDVTAGHIYRETFPYEVAKAHIAYNQLYIEELLLPYPIKEKLFANQTRIHNRIFSESYQTLKNNYKEVKTEKEYLKSILGNADRFVHINSVIEKTNQNHIFNNS